MQLFYIRHAQSVNNALDLQENPNGKRSEDPPLTGVGEVQAKKLARFLKEGDSKEIKHCGNEGFQITHLYCSLMVRAVQTGTIIAQELDLPLLGLEEIHECGGIYLENRETGEIACLPGKDKAYFQGNFPQLVLPESMVESGWWDSRPVEKPEVSLARARQFIKLLKERHGNEHDRVAIVSHGGFYNDLVTSLIDLPMRNGLWFSLYNTAITRVDIHKDFTELVYQNRVDHLPCELIT